MAEIVIKLVNGELAGKTMQQLNKEVTAANLALKKAEAGTSDFVKATERLDKAKQLQADMKKQIEGTTSASDMLKKSWNNLPGAQFFNQIGDSFGMMKSGVGGLVSQFGVLKTAIAATGLGALVLILGSLFAWFTKTDEGATKLDGIMRAIGNTVDVLLNRLINLKDSLTTLFTNPGQFFRGLVTDIKEGIALGQELADTFDELDQKRRDMELVDASQSVAIQKLLLQSKNVSLSYAERLAILDKVDAIERENYQTKLKYAVDYATAVTKETEIMEKNGTITDEQLDKQNEARIKLLAVQGESIVLQEKIENRRSALLEKQQAEREKDLAKREKENEQLLKSQEKFYEQQHKLQEKEDLFQENRRSAELKKIEKHAKDSMLIALDSLKQRNDEYEKSLVERQAIADAENAIEQEKLSVFNQGTASIISLLGATTEARRKNANQIKALEVGQVIVNGVSEVSEIAKTFAKLGPVGQILAAFRIAFSVARTVAGVARINAQKFETGGVVNGPRHAQGGVPIEAEGGEFIFSRKATRALGVNMLNAINRRLTFADGGMVPSNPFTTSSAAVSSASASNVGNAFAGNDELKNAFLMFAGEVRGWQRNLKVVNNLQETEKGLATLNQLRNEADV